MNDLSRQDSVSEVLTLARTERSVRGPQDGHARNVQQRAELPATLDVPEAARLLGIGRTLAYDLIRTHRWPTPVIRVGRLIKIPSGPLVELMTTGAAGY